MPVAAFCCLLSACCCQCHHFCCCCLVHCPEPGFSAWVCPRLISESVPKGWHRQTVMNAVWKPDSEDAELEVGHVVGTQDFGDKYRVWNLGLGTRGNRNQPGYNQPGGNEIDTTNVISFPLILTELWWWEETGQMRGGAMRETQESDILSKWTVNSLFLEPPMDIKSFTMSIEEEEAADRCQGWCCHWHFLYAADSYTAPWWWSAPCTLVVKSSLSLEVRHTPAVLMSVVSNVNCGINIHQLNNVFYGLPLW